jgi:hypothetical protein
MKGGLIIAIYYIVNLRIFQGFFEVIFAKGCGTLGKGSPGSFGIV